MAGMLDWMEVDMVVHAAEEVFGGLGRAGLITVIVVSVVAIVAFVWIFRETRRRD
jgi:hypothetical protein